MFSSRRPSLSEALHFVNTEDGVNETITKSAARRNAKSPAHIPYRASSPSSSLTTSGATESMGEGKSIMIQRDTGSQMRDIKKVK